MRSRLIELPLLFGAIMLIFSSSLQAESRDPLVVGWVERATIYPGDVALSAKMDTGALTCSLHSNDLQLFPRDGRSWVRVTIRDQQGNEKTIETQIVGRKRIKRHFGRFQDRLVIRLGICVGTVFKEVEVNLVDRSGLEYPMLIGRNFMRGDLLVNPKAKFTVEPSCSPESSMEPSEP